MSIWDERKIDCHVHVLDPGRFPYAPDVRYRPSGQEIAPVEQLACVLDAYGVTHALIVGPNSGYGTDNRCLLDALARGAGRFKGVAVVRNDIGRSELERLKDAGIVGVAFNTTVEGSAYYANTEPLLALLAALDMFVQVQAEHDQLVPLAPLLVASRARILIDHCGRPTPQAGLEQQGFRTVLELGRTGRAFVKLSGYQKFAREAYPYPDVTRYVDALVEAFTLERCVWASDWPYLRAPARLDYGPLLRLAAKLFADAADRRKLMWDTPARLFRFDS
jgi:predicted TIM-barrel fold metal-dependent hydrolase